MDNQVIQAIRNRRSCRSFKAEMVPSDLVDKVVEAGLWAASGKGKQAPVILKITNKELRDRLSEANRIIGGWKEGFDPFYGAPVVLVVLAPKDVATYLYDGSLALGNLMLAAHSLGLGSIWIHRAKEEFAQPEWAQMLADLGLEGEWEGIGHCALGFVDKSLPEGAQRKAGRVLDGDALV